jgi:hypothetical protein
MTAQRKRRWHHARNLHGRDSSGGEVVDRLGAGVARRDSQGATREELLENLRDALDEAIEMNRQEAKVAASAPGGYEEVELVS